MRSIESARELRAKAAYYRQLAEQVGDREIRGELDHIASGYLQLAEQVQQRESAGAEAG
jgi:hypothetical protein